MSRAILHQVSVGATIGDAITDHALTLRRWLREMGFISEIFAEHIHPDLKNEIRPIATYKPRADEHIVIYHHGIGSPVVERLLESSMQIVMIYHNITPPEFFSSIDPELERQMVWGRQQLAGLCPRTILALGVSPYNEAELRQTGFSKTAVLPLTLNEPEYNVPTNPSIAGDCRGCGPLLLFVGRIVPNKKQEDLIKLFYFYKRLRPEARLVLLGTDWVPAYTYWLQDLATDLGVKDSVTFTGFLSHRDLVSYYRLAALYVSMSEHEGFGRPFIESMYLGLPIMAYAAGGVPDTLGGAGVLFHHKDFEALAELADILITNQILRERIIARQRERVRGFLEPAVRKHWEAILSGLGLKT